MFTSDSDTASPADARKLALSFLHVHCPDADVDAVQIVLSELVTNAVRHTVTGVWSLDLNYDNSHGDGIGLLTLRVHDRDISLPRQRNDSSFGGHPLDGRGVLGLPLVDKLADQIGVERTRDGKRSPRSGSWPEQAVHSPPHDVGRVRTLLSSLESAARRPPSRFLVRATAPRSGPVFGWRGSNPQCPKQVVPRRGRGGTADYVPGTECTCRSE